MSRKVVLSRPTENEETFTPRLRMGDAGSTGSISFKPKKVYK
jgi:hypothetical protein